MKRILILSILTCVLSFNQAFSQVYNWQPTNGPEGGRIFDLYAHDAQIMLATSYFTGNLYRSTNGGASWAQVGPTAYWLAPFVRHSSGTILSSNGTLMWRSTDAGLTWTPGGLIEAYTMSMCVDGAGNAYAGNTSTPNPSVFKSTDVGLTWTKTSLIAAGQIQSLAATSTGAILAATTQGVHRSTDRGGTWQQVNSGLTTLNVRTIAVNQTLIFAATLGGGVFRSDDDGKNWNRMSTGLSNSAYDLVVGTFGQLYVTNNLTVYRSVNNGVTWGIQGNAGFVPGSTRLLANSDGTLFAFNSDFGLLRSTDAGNNWTPGHTGIKLKTTNVLVSNSVGHVFAASDGIHRTTNLGASWTQVGSPALEITSMAASTGSVMYAGTTTGVYRSTDNGSSWQTTPITQQSIVAAGQGNTAYAGNSLAMFRSTNAGVSWDSVNTGLPRGSYRAVAVSPNGTVYASISGKGLFRSSNSGISWIQTALSVDAYALLCVSDQVLYAASNVSSGGVYRSTDQGNSWQKLSGGLPGSYATSLAVGPQGILFAGFQGNGIYKSTNSGTSWSASNQGLPTSYVYSLLCLPSGALMAGLYNAPVCYSIPYYPPPAPSSAYSFNSLVYPGSVRIGQFRDSALVIFNLGTDTMKITSIVSSNPAFTSKLSSVSLPPSSAIYDTLRFAPLSAGLISGVILVTSNAATSPDTIKVSGVGGGQSTMVLGATSISFGSTKVGQYKDAQLTMLNTGNDTLMIQSITSTNALFSARPTSRTVPPGTSFVDTIRFAPTAVAYEAGTLHIISNALTSPDSVTVSGVGSGIASFASSASTVSFGSVQTGKYMDTLVTFSNLGNDTLKITGIASTHGSFSARPTSKIIPPGLSFGDTVRFAPTALGAVSGSVVITSNATTSPDTIRVSGEGVAGPTGIAEEAIPKTFELSQNYPNPFNPATVIRFAIPEASQVSLKIFNTLGQVVATLVDGRREAGYHQANWYAAGSPSGIYIYRLQAGSFMQSAKMILLR